MLRVHRVPHSTNVERIALAAGHKGLAVAWVDHPWDDRSGIRAVSGQDLAPVLETPDGAVVCDSPVILRWLEDHHPEPPLWPRAPARAAEADVFVEWFNGVWKGPPNALADGRGTAADATDIRRRLDVFEDLLAGRDHLLGDAFGIADVVAWPFLRYATAERDPDDPDPFHAVLREHLAPAGPRLRAWIARCADRPRA